MIDPQTVANAITASPSLMEGIKTSGILVAVAIFVNAGVKIFQMVLGTSARKKMKEEISSQMDDAQTALHCASMSRVETYCKEAGDYHKDQKPIMEGIKKESETQTKILGSLDRKFGIVVAYQRGKNGSRLPEDDL